MEYLENPELKLAFDFVQFTNKNIFLTGKAGTGKTTFLRYIKEISPKRMIVVAPTGVAAINAGGVTIHSFFQMPFGPHIPTEKNIDILDEETPQTQQRGVQKFNREKINIIKSLDLLVIDEISMVRADLLDGIDEVLRRYKNHNRPFGGVQLLMIGDIQQLAPIAKDDEWEILKRYYNTVYFFSSNALRKTNYVSIELKHIYRQSDRDFIEILNQIRENSIDSVTLETLNRRHIPNINNQDNEGYITLTTHNHQSNRINESKLQKLKEKLHTYKASTKGEFPEYSYPTDFELSLKVGAQVMFVKNDISPEKLYYNGKIGTVVDIDDDIVMVRCEGDHADIPVVSVDWHNYKYTIDEQSNEISESIIGTFTQYPLKLAWAITIHKSQGLTFEKAIIDANSAFAHGQVYVALSRCKTLEGMILSSPISTQSIKSDRLVQNFSRDIEQNPPSKKLLSDSKNEYQQILLTELFDFTVIHKRLNYCIKLLKENESIVFGDIHEEFSNISSLLKNEILEVNNRFNVQLQQLITPQSDIENSPAIQERIRKACIYYTEKTETIFNPIIGKISLETDNKAVRKSITSVWEKLNADLIVKIACLKVCQSGFNVKEYVNTKAKTSIEKTEYKPTKQKSGPAKTDSNIHPELAEMLKIWRNSKFNKLKVPAYVVLPQRALLELANHLPTSISELKVIKGFGKKRIDQFGSEILDIIINYRNDNGITTESTLFEEAGKTKKEKVDTKQTTYDLFVTGKSIELIAAERQMAVTTIEGHIAHFIRLGMIDIQRLVSPSKVELISQYFQNSETLHLTPAKETLGDDVTYGEIKLVLGHLQHQGIIEDNNK